MKTINIINIIMIIFCSTLNAQIQSNNKNEGIVISNSINIKVI